MKMTNAIIAVLGGLLALWLESGCTSPPASPSPGTPDAKQASGFFPHVEKTGGQIWAENCTRCHNPRPATQYTAQQWDLITSHMRQRCNLNGEEQRAVYHFLSGV